MLDYRAEGTRSTPSTSSTRGHETSHNKSASSSSAGSTSATSSSYVRTHGRQLSSGSASTLESEMEDWEDAVSFFETSDMEAGPPELLEGPPLRPHEMEKALEELGWGGGALAGRLEERSPKGKGRVEKGRVQAGMDEPRRARLSSEESDIHPRRDRAGAGSSRPRRASSASQYATTTSTKPPRPAAAKTMRRSSPSPSDSSSDSSRRNSFTSTDLNDLDIQGLLYAFDDASLRERASVESTPTRRRPAPTFTRVERNPSTSTRGSTYGPSRLHSVDESPPQSRRPPVPPRMSPTSTSHPLPLVSKKSKLFSLSKKKSTLPPPPVSLPPALRSIPTTHYPTYVPPPPFLDPFSTNSRRASLTNQSIVSSDSVGSSMRSMGGSVSSGSGSGRSGSSNSFRWSIASASTSRTIAEAHDGDSQWAPGGSRRASLGTNDVEPPPIPEKVIPESFSWVTVAPREAGPAVETGKSMRFRSNSGGPLLVSGEGMEAEVDWDNLFGDREADDHAPPSPTLSNRRPLEGDGNVRPLVKPRKLPSSPKSLSKSRSEVAADPMPTIKGPPSRRSSLGGLWSRA